jgi:hypothetical protein
MSFAMTKVSFGVAAFALAPTASKAAQTKPLSERLI